MEHCWHDEYCYGRGTVGLVGFTCCWCGLKHDDFVRVPDLGHGKHVKVTKKVERPTGPCPGCPKETK